MYTIYGKPNCPYCVRAKELLDAKGLEYNYFDVTKDSTKMEEMSKLVIEATGKPARTVPQIVSPEGEYIGGFDDLYATFNLSAVASAFDEF